MNVRRITTTGANKTYYVTIPKEIIQKLKWRKGQKVFVNFSRDRKKIMIEDWEEPGSFVEKPEINTLEPTLV